MLSAIVKVQRWWGQTPARSAVEEVSFEIVCSCGQRHQGWRQATHQVVKCGCGRRRFVLPTSPLPRVSTPRTRPVPVMVPSASRRRSPWLGPLIGAGATLLIVIGIFAVILIMVGSRSAKQPNSISAGQLEAFIANGQKALDHGDFAEASQSFEEVREGVKRNPTLLPAGRFREVEQLRRQAARMADWPGERMELVLSQAAGLGDDDWQALANRRRGRTLVFDGTLRRDATGQLHVNRAQPVEGQTFHVKLQSLKLLTHLPLAEPTRVIFLARLANARREAPGVHAIELDADSGVLITDERVAKRCGYAVGDGELRQVLERQTRWVADAHEPQ